tara:strand:- start:202 stop:462 length:261 start_codon:yes stop_codon:yes gene_type:complete
MDTAEIQLDGDPRKIAKAIFQAAKETYRGKHGKLEEWDLMRSEMEAEIPMLAKQMAEALEPEVKEVYLINALEVMALSYARRELRT